MQPRLLLGLLLWLMLSMVAEAATITVGSNGSDFTSIQEAIDIANPGDKILVYSGSYYENLDVNKQLILYGVDTGIGIPTISAKGCDNVITLSADGCLIVGFEIKDSGNWFLSDSGIKVISNNNIIAYNNICNNSNGIFLMDSNNNTIINNSINHNDIGIFMGDSRNELFYVGPPGSSNNIIIGNNISNNWDGILFWNSNDNSIINNDISFNEMGVDIYDHSANNKVMNNEIVYNLDCGVIIWNSNNSNNIVADNLIHYNDVGISFCCSKLCNSDLQDSKENIITDNIIVYNTMRGIVVPDKLGRNIIDEIKNNNRIDSTIGVYNCDSSVCPATPHISVTIKTSPEGANIYIDEKNLGITPKTVYFSVGGNFSLNLSKDGYEIYGMDLIVPMEKEDNEMIFVLKRL